MNKLRLGFFGGCFNPPTIAHIKLMELVLEKENLDKVYFVPMGDLYPKKDLIKIEHRWNMIKLAIKDNPKLDISDIQVKQNRRTYAIESFELINEAFSESENFFIMGSDNFKKIDNWKNAEKLLSSNYQYIVLNRDSLEIENTENLKIDDENLKNMSSSLVREKIKKQESIQNLVTKEVEHYILENGLYK